MPDPDSCPFAKDGVCDEPANCPLGTDDTDCKIACAAGGSPLIRAACSYRAAAKPPRCARTAVPSGHGTVNLTGWRDGAIPVRSGDVAVQVPVPRHYRLYVPTRYDPACPAPLVLNLPGNGADIYGLPENTELGRVAELDGFIVAFVEQEWRARSDWWSWWTDWDWTDDSRDNPDLSLIRALVQRIEEEYAVDRSRVFVTGHSRGAAMALIAGFELPDVVAGVVSESGFAELSYCARILRHTSGRRVPIVLIHGVADTNVRIGTADPCTGARATQASDAIAAMLRGLGWTDQDLLYYRLPHVQHRWQPQYDQEWFDFLANRPLSP